jgi:phospholipase/carboxylesterase
MVKAISTFVTGGLDHIEPGQPVVVFLHGYGADERDLPSLMNFLPDLPWVSLRAPQTSQYGGYAWYPITNALDPSLEEVADATEAVWDWVDSFLPEDSPLVVIGFSQGGLMATQLLRTRPARLAATVILAGFVFGGEQPADAELAANKPKVIYCRGLEDQMISREAVAGINGWLQGHTRAITRTYAGLGHSIDDRVMADVADYLSLVLKDS